MDPLIKSETFSCRISPAERDFINENALDILGDSTPRHRNFLLNAVTTATQKLSIQKKSLPQDQEKIKELEKRLQLTSESNEDLSLLTKDHEDALKERDQQIEDLDNEVNDLRELLQKKESQIRTLQVERERPAPSNPMELKINLDPLTKHLLDVTSQRLTRKYKKEITASMVLKDMFLRYTRDRVLIVTLIIRNGRIFRKPFGKVRGILSLQGSRSIFSRKSILFQ